MSTICKFVVIHNLLPKQFEYPFTYLLDFPYITSPSPYACPPPSSPSLSPSTVLHSPASPSFYAVPASPSNPPLAPSFFPIHPLILLSPITWELYSVHSRIPSLPNIWFIINDPFFVILCCNTCTVLVLTFLRAVSFVVLVLLWRKNT